jgi:hypothetical protein
MRIESKHLFSENISPLVKSLVMKRRAGIKLTEREERRLQKESYKINHSVGKPKRDDDYDEEFLEIILKEMGYGDEEEEEEEPTLNMSDIPEVSDEEMEQIIRDLTYATGE